MSDEQNPTGTAPAANVEAEKDVQNVLAELKAEEGAAPTEEKKEPESNGAAPSDEAAEEARIVAEAAKLGEKSEEAESKTEEKSQKSRTGRGERPNYRDNIKFDPTSRETTSDPVEIRKQVEFYFSDSNLPMDKFLLSKVGGSANRPVELSLLHSFKRMRRFQPFSAVVEALKSSETLELVDNDTKVVRKVPLPESVNENPDADIVKVFEDKAMDRSIYAKGFGDEEPSTQFDIEAFFGPYGPTNAIRLRRHYDKTFKGSVFVEFDSEETQKKFLALDPKPKWKGQDLLIKSKRQYCDEKVKDIEAGRIKPNRGRGGSRNHGRGDNRDWKERRAEDQKRGFKGGRGGRGGRGRGNGRGNGRDNARENGRENGRSQEIQKDARGVPVIQSTTGGDEASKKRAREEDGNANGAQNGDHPAKKVDAKEA
ncbi:hypothetical protein DTO166G4_4984 [Paecilomyces variotii]|nr:hypothetical protein DTO166G4_4984 [Paecilomyces variotii]KAJ9240124.1 hypothetical protein DTO166G5_1989 [Paecilomyces variotii]